MNKYNKLEQVIILVNSLSKSEKRYFRLYAQIQQGSKDYMALFDLIEQGNTVDEVYDIFKTRNIKQHPSIIAKYLYEVIIDCLLSLRSKHDTEYRLFQSVTKAGILFERGLHASAFHELDNAKKMAQLYEFDVLSQLIIQLKLKLSRTLDFINITDEKSLINEYFQMNEILKSCRNTNVHFQLYDVLRYRTMFADKMQPEELKDLVLGELYLMSRHTHKRVETQKLHTLFQASYYLHIGRSKLAVKYFKELIVLFENNKYQILNPPIYYSMAIKGIIKSLIVEHLYKDAFFFIDKLENLVSEDYPLEFNIKTVGIAHKYRMIVWIKSGNTEAVGDFVENVVIPFCKNNSHILRSHDLLGIYLCISVVYSLKHKWREAKRYTNKILNTSEIYNNTVFRISRLINVVVGIELKDHEYCQHEINYIKRHYPFCLKTEKLLFSYVAFYFSVTSSNHKKQLLRDKIVKSALLIKKEKTDLEINGLFDFIEWIYVKLSKE